MAAPSENAVLVTTMLIATPSSTTDDSSSSLEQATAARDAIAMTAQPALSRYPLYPIVIILGLVSADTLGKSIGAVNDERRPIHSRAGV